MAFSHKCGLQLTLGTEKFCPRCGVKLQQHTAVGGIEVTDTRGDVVGAGVGGTDNVISKELGSYTRQGNIIHLHVNNVSYDVLEKITNTPTRINVSSPDSRNVENSKGNLQGTLSTKQQTSLLLADLTR